MPVSTEFLRGVLGVLCVFFGHMAGRALGGVRTGRQKISKLYGWGLRLFLCAAIMVFRHELDVIALAVWGLAALAFAAGWWDVVRPREQDDLTREIFPE
jgi:hypothetical protein